MRLHMMKALAPAMALFCGLGGPASAEESDRRGYLGSHVPAPVGALELKAASGYTQGFGNIAPGRDLDRVGGAGIGVGADLDYRLTPAWSVGVEGQYQAISGKDNTSARGVTANMGATYHLAPVLRGDPWVRLGTGYRWVWENDVGGVSGMNTLRHGFAPESRPRGPQISGPESQGEI